MKADGTRLTGSVQGVTFLADGAHGIYPRGLILALHVGAEGKGKDKCVLEGAGAREGKLVSVRFRTDAGEVTVPRQLIASIELSAADKTVETLKPTPAKPAKKDKPDPEPDDAEAAARKALGYKNLDLRNHYWDGAPDFEKNETAALKQEYLGQCKQVVDEINRIQRTIQQKEKRRDDRMREYQRDRRREEERRAKGQRSHHVEKPHFNDGLEKDQASLRKAYGEKRKLQGVIKKEMDALKDRTKERRRRVGIVYAHFKQASATGEKPTIERMTERYEAAVDLDGKRKKDDGKKDDGKKRKK